jgi:hypothetical protein
LSSTSIAEWPRRRQLTSSPSGEVAANERTLRATQDALEAQLVLAATPSGQDPRRKLKPCFDDFSWLSREI